MLFILLRRTTSILNTRLWLMLQICHHNYHIKWRQRKHLLKDSPKGWCKKKGDMKKIIQWSTVSQTESGFRCTRKQVLHHVLLMSKCSASNIHGNYVGLGNSQRSFYSLLGSKIKGHASIYMSSVKCMPLSNTGGKTKNPNNLRVVILDLEAEITIMFKNTSS